MYIIMIENVNSCTLSKKSIVYFLLPILFLLIVFPSVVQPGQIFISDSQDTMTLVMPELFLMEHPLALWNYDWITGFPAISDVNTDRFYPFSFPFFLVSQNIFVVNLILFVNLYIAYLAFFKLGSYLVKNNDLLLIFSLGYMFSGVLLSRILAGHISFVYAMAWIPLIYYFFLKLILDSDSLLNNMIGLTICEALLFFTGAVYYAFFCNAILLILFLYYLGTKKLNVKKIISLSIAMVLMLSITAIKLIPNIVGLQYIQRIDIINPLGDGGLLENNLAAFVAGLPIDTVFGSHETMALIGIIPIFFAIIALVWGRQDVTVPLFFAIVFTFIWADGGRTLLSMIHLLPLVSSFRNAGRIFGAIMPLVLLLAIYGVDLLHQKIKNNEPLKINIEQRNNILIGVSILVLLKLLELPWITIPSIEAALSSILIAGLILIILLNKSSPSILAIYFSVALLIDIVLITKNFSLMTEPVLIKGALIATILVAALLWFNRTNISGKWVKNHVFEGLLIIGILISVTGNISVLQLSDPHLSDSPALAVIEKINEYPKTTSQIWVYEIGWPVKHLDFTFWMIKNNIHPMRAYYSYSPTNTPPAALKIGNMDYFTADYIIDTAYLENGEQNLKEVTFKVNNISVFKPENVLPNAFVVRDNQIVPSKIEVFNPDEVTIAGSFLTGDTVVLKTAYYPGWKINGQETGNIGNMVGGRLAADTTRITIRFDPWESKVGMLLTCIGVLALILVIVKRKDLERLLTRPNAKQTKDLSSKKKKRQ